MEGVKEVPQPETVIKIFFRAPSKVLVKPGVATVELANSFRLGDLVITAIIRAFCPAVKVFIHPSLV